MRFCYTRQASFMVLSHSCWRDRSVACMPGVLVLVSATQVIPDGAATLKGEAFIGAVATVTCDQGFYLGAHMSFFISVYMVYFVISAYIVHLAIVVHMALYMALLPQRWQDKGCYPDHRCCTGSDAHHPNYRCCAGTNAHQIQCLGSDSSVTGAHWGVPTTGQQRVHCVNGRLDVSAVCSLQQWAFCCGV